MSNPLLFRPVWKVQHLKHEVHGPETACDARKQEKCALFLSKRLTEDQKEDSHALLIHITLLSCLFPSKRCADLPDRARTVPWVSQITSGGNGRFGVVVTWHLHYEPI